MKKYAMLIACMMISLLQMEAQEYKQIQNRWKADHFLHNEGRILQEGPLGLPGWHSAHWQFIKVPGTKYVQIRNRFGNDFYLHNEYGTIQVGPLGRADWWSAQWEILKVPNTEYVRIRNRYRPDQYIHIQNGRIEVGALGAPDWLSAQWKLVTLGAATPPPIVANPISEIEKSYAANGIAAQLGKLENRAPVSKKMQHNRAIPNYDPGKHVQGMAVFNDGTYLATHNLDDGMGYQILMHGNQVVDWGEEHIGWLQSGAQACGQFVATSTSLNDGNKNSEIRFYQKKLGKLQRIPHLTIEESTWIEEVGFVYNPVDKCHYVATPDYFYKSNGRSLLDPLCRFERISMEKAFPKSTSGIALIFDKADSGLYYITLIDDENTDKINLYKINLLNSKASASFVKSYNLSPVVKIQSSFVDVVADSKAGFRWGSSVYVNSAGNVLATACSRQGHNGYFQVAEWDPNREGEKIETLEQRGQQFLSVLSSSFESYINPIGGLLEEIFLGEKVPAPARGATQANIPKNVRHYVVTLFHITNWKSGGDGSDIELYGAVSLNFKGAFYTNPGANQYLFNKRAGDYIVLKTGTHYSKTEKKDLYIDESKASNAQIGIFSNLMEHDDFDNDHVYGKQSFPLGSLEVGFYKEYELFVNSDGDGEVVRIYFAISRVQ